MTYDHYLDMLNDRAFEDKAEDVEPDDIEENDDNLGDTEYVEWAGVEHKEQKE